MKTTFLTVPKVAAQLRISKPTAYRLVEVGELRAVRIGRSIRVRAEDLDAYLARCSTAPAERRAVSC